MGLNSQSDSKPYETGVNDNNNISNNGHCFLCREIFEYSLEVSKLYQERSREKY